jgi:hypothetical protein
LIVRVRELDPVGRDAGIVDATVGNGLFSVTWALAVAVGVARLAAVTMTEFTLGMAEGGV